VFCESGVLLGFFLPGDSLLFTAGFLAGLGAALWGAGLPVAGAVLGSTVPSADRYLLPAVLVIIAGSAIASSSQVLRRSRSAAETDQEPSPTAEDD
jgi:membrane protein DedA with SNARE-associated domain